MAVALLALAGAVAAALSPARPAGSAAASITLDFVFAVFLTWMASRARRWAWILLAALTAVTAQSWGAQIAGGIALLAAAASAFSSRRWRPVGALIGALCANGLLWGTVLPLAPAVAAGCLATLAVVASAYRSAPRSRRRRWRAGALGLGLIVLAILLGFAVAADQAKSNADRGMKQLRAGIASARRGDRQQAATQLRSAAKLLADVHDQMSTPWALPATTLPILGPNATAARRLAATSAALGDTAANAVDAAQLDQFTLRSGRLDLAAVHQAQPGLAHLSTELAAASMTLERTRSPWLFPPVADRVASGQSILRNAQPDTRLALDAVSIAPLLLGDTQPRSYFVAFTTPTEARGRTGFLGNYAELEVNAGKISMTRFGRTNDLDTTGTPLAQRKLTGPDDYVRRYNRFAPAQTWHNVTMSPDFPTVAQVIADLYRQSGGRQVDGVISIDPEGLAALLQLTGPVKVTGIDTPVSSTNAASILYQRQYVDLPNNTDRIDVLEELAHTTFNKLTQGGLPGLRTLVATLGPSAVTGHIQFEPLDPKAKAFIHEVNADGAMPAVNGDSLGVVVNNAGGNKVDQFLATSIKYDVQWDPRTRAVKSTATVTLHNGSPSAGLPDYIIGSAVKNGPGVQKPPTGTNRMFLSVYSPFIPVTSSIDGKGTPLQVERETGRFVSSTFLDIGPGQTRTLTVTWSGQLPTPVYHLDLIHQPSVHAQTAAVSVTTRGNTTRRTFVLDRIRRLTVSAP